MTKEQIAISERNKRKALVYFGIDKMGKREFDLHHVDQSLRHNDIERYIQWNPEDLIVLTHAEHTSLHHKGKVISEETKQKLREANLGKTQSEETKKKRSESLKGTIFTKERKKHISEALKGNTNTRGMKWFNNGEINTRAYECPEGFITGRLLSDDTKYRMGHPRSAR